MSTSARSPADEKLVAGVSRRSACTMLGLGAMLLGQRTFAADTGIESALAEQYALMRRAYQTGDADLLRQFYSNDVVLATEGSSPIVGLDSAIAAGHAVLAKRRDISVDLLRVTHSVQGDAASHFAKLVAYPRDPAESPRVATALLLWQRGAVGWRCNAELVLIQDMDAVAGFRTTKRATSSETQR
jgi:ketosteroid isomerase-like protein